MAENRFQWVSAEFNVGQSDGVPGKLTEWNRATVADGKWLNNETVVPLSGRDEYLLGSINELSNDVDTLAINSSIMSADIIHNREMIETKQNLLSAENFKPGLTMYDDPYVGIKIAINTADTDCIQSVMLDNDKLGFALKDTISARNIISPSPFGTVISGFSEVDANAFNAYSVSSNYLNTVNTSGTNAKFDNLSADNLMLVNLTVENLSAYNTSAVKISAVSGIEASTDYGVDSYISGFNTIYADKFSGTSAEIDKIVSIGSDNSYNGNQILLNGSNNVASGENIMAAGYHVSAFGKKLTVNGDYAIASGDNVTVFGKYNTYENSDKLFVVGNGTNEENRSDAMIIFDNGTLSAKKIVCEDSDFDNKYIEYYIPDSVFTSYKNTVALCYSHNLVNSWEDEETGDIIREEYPDENYAQVINNDIELWETEVKEVSPWKPEGADESDIRKNYRIDISFDIENTRYEDDYEAHDATVRFYLVAPNYYTGADQERIWHVTIMPGQHYTNFKASTILNGAAVNFDTKSVAVPLIGLEGLDVATPVMDPESEPQFKVSSIITVTDLGKTKKPETSEDESDDNY